MTKEELEKEAEEWVISNTEIYDDKFGIEYETEHRAKEAYLACAEPREKRIAELEKKISVLLSCANCSENKGGYICKKEYENKCLTQKIQYIKELQEEIAELKEDLRNKKLAIQNRKGRIKELEEENAELEAQIKKMKCCENCKYYKPCVTVNETIGNECEDFYNGCNNSVIVPFGKWKIKEND